MEQSDSREKLFDSSLNTVNVSVNTEHPMDSSSNPKEEVTHYFHFYGDMDDVFHRVIVLIILHTQHHTMMRIVIMGKGILMQA